jgi:pyruvate,water dikinase
MQQTRGSVDDALLGRLQNSASDRNWDSIKALWEMKEEAKADPELAAAFANDTAAEIIAALGRSERGDRFMSDRVRPYQREFGWHAVWSHEFVFPTVREQLEPVIDLIRNYLDTDYDYPSAIDAMRRDIEAASREVLEGLTGDALDEMRAANATNLRMAPLTPDHHFYIDQGANAHVRLVLMAIGQKLVEAGRLDRPDDVMYLRYNELRMLIGDASALDARGLVGERRAERDAAKQLHPPNWIGTATPSQLAFPYLVNWGYPERFHQGRPKTEGPVTGIAASPGVIEGVARVVMTVDEFDDVAEGDILVCQMTNPAWVVLFTRIAGLVTDTGGTTSHPAVLSREFGIPAVVGTSVATKRIRTGDRIRVDGSKGTVEVLESGGSSDPGATSARTATATPIGS